MLKRTAFLIAAALSGAATAAPPAPLDAAGLVKRWETFLDTADATGELRHITALDAEVTSAARHRGHRL